MIPDFAVKKAIDVIFMKYDKDRSNTLQSSQLTGCFNELLGMVGVPSSANGIVMKMLLKKIDKDHDGRISKPEFLTLFRMFESMGFGGGHGNQQQNQGGWGGQQQSGWGGQGGQHQGGWGGQQQGGWGGQQQGGWGGQQQGGWSNQPPNNFGGQGGWGQQGGYSNQGPGSGYGY